MPTKRTSQRGRSVLVGASVAAAAGVGVLGYGSLIERNWFTVRRETVAILPPGASDLRVLHLSDIHLNKGQARKREWLASLAELEPDLVVNTGDNLTHPRAIEPLLEALRPLMDFPGVFVPGSNDYYAPMFRNPASYLFRPSNHVSSAPPNKQPKPLDTAKLHGGFGAGGWVNLTNRHQSLAIAGIRFDFTGVDDPHLQRDRYTGWPLGSSSSDAAPHVKIAVAHAPYQRVLDTFTNDDADLILAGHTHGGQICIPGYGALVSNCDLPTWRAKGLTVWESNGKSTPLNVSGGIGTSRTAPIRLACRPEAVLITLTARS